MKKMLIALALLISLGASVEAASSIKATTTNEIMRSTHTWGGVTISSAPALDVMGTQPTPSYSQVAVQNNDGAFNIYCSENINVATSGILKGVKISVGALVSVILRPGQPFYCIHDGASGTVEPSVFRGR